MLYQYIDNFSMVKGSHSFRMGTDIQSVTAITFNDTGIIQGITIGTNNANPDGILNSHFPNLPAGATGTAIVNRAKTVYADLVGLLGSSSQTFNVSSPTSGFVPGATRQRDFKQRQVSLYSQDQWRARRNFTLNYGMRWEFQGVPMRGMASRFSRSMALRACSVFLARTIFSNPASWPGTAPTSLDFVNGDTGKKLYNDDWNNFAPFIGIAYSPDFKSGPMNWLFGSEGKTFDSRRVFSISYLQDGFTVVSNALGTGTTNPGLIQTAANNTPDRCVDGCGCYR